MNLNYFLGWSAYNKQQQESKFKTSELLCYYFLKYIKTEAFYYYITYVFLKAMNNLHFKLQSLQRIALEKLC